MGQPFIKVRGRRTARMQKKATEKGARPTGALRAAKPGFSYVARVCRVSWARKTD